MRGRAVHIVLGVLGLGIGFVGVLALREATLSTHQAVDPGSQLEFLVEVESSGGERTQTLAEMTEAIFLTCRLEVNSDLVGKVEQVDDEVFRAVLTPSLDQTDRRQFRGCLEDWSIDHVLVDVLQIEERSVAS